MLHEIHRVNTIICLFSFYACSFKIQIFAFWTRSVLSTVKLFFESISGESKADGTKKMTDCYCVIFDGFKNGDDFVQSMCVKNCICKKRNVDVVN